MSHESTALDVLRAVARQRWHYASPYRLGILAGELGLQLPCPYRPGSVAAGCWASGVSWGRSRDHKAPA